MMMTTAQPAGFVRLTRFAVIVGAVGVLLMAIGAAVDARQAAFSWLAAFAFWLSIALGALLLLMILHTINASWFIVLRRITEAAADPLIVLVVLFIPILLGLPALYPWAQPIGTLDPETAAAIQTKRAYLNVPFFVARAVVYFGVWIFVSQKLRRWSVAMQHADDATRILLARKQRVLSATLLPAVAFALTFAAFDWLMSLMPAWYSTIYGVYYFAGGILAALAMLAIATWRLQPVTSDAITTSHVHATGKLILTFLIFWAYTGYAQLLLIWIANIPAEAAWYDSRLNTGWSAVGAILLVGHFVLPLLALLSRDLKRRAGVLAIVSAWLLVMHYVDIYWLVLPVLYPSGPAPHWLDIAALAAVGGPVVAFAAWRLRNVPLIPVGDPRLERSIRFVTR